MRKDNIRIASLVVVATLEMVSFFPSFSEEPELQYQLKAAFIHKFLLFAEWPRDESVGPKESIIIGILGKDPFENAFEPIEGELVNGLKLVIRRFKSETSDESFKECDLLFVRSLSKNRLKNLLESLKSDPVLTVSDAEGFIEAGGMINFIRRENTVKFEINKGAAERVGIKFRSKLLRVAVRVIEDPDEGLHE